MFLKEGDRCNEKFFINKGCVYISYARQNGMEQVIDFGIENLWASDFLAFQHRSVAVCICHINFLNRVGISTKTVSL
jgi:hypothetical protein